MVRRSLILFAMAVAMVVSPVGAEPPSNPISNFDKAKKVARDQVYADRHVEDYCGCKWTPMSTSGGVIDATECGYVSRSPNPDRGKRLEWEHAMPAWFFGHERSCWSRTDARCEASGKKTRMCCRFIDEEFRKIEADLHNLLPSVGELNGDRSNLPYGEVPDEPRAYGRCDFEIGGNPRVAEPPANVKGDVARIWFYMNQTYGISISSETMKVLEAWSAADPVDEWELERDKLIEAIQGNRNPFVRPGDV